MAIFAIPNPTKNIKVNFSLSETRKAICNISRLNSNYKKENFNETIENYKFSASETLDLGSYVDISLNEIDTNKTEINITISRKIGTFNKSFEVTNANNHLDIIINLISSTIGKSDKEIDEIIIRQNKEIIAKTSKNKKVAKWFYSIFAILALAFYYYVNYIHKK
ncbi:hypothetical protein [Flavobacterium sasangense]|uniref:hypothetical protein n=1 Tax=Flavobacterium sasangense TaxID=503361 RepID=UPI0004790CF3|nr:hypothetical protein [Flavobacterium sasangense]